MFSFVPSVLFFCGRGETRAALAPTITTVTLSPLAPMVGGAVDMSVALTGWPPPTQEYRWRVDGNLAAGAAEAQFTPLTAMTLIGEARATNASGQTVWVPSSPVSVVFALAPDIAAADAVTDGTEALLLARTTPAVPDVTGIQYRVNGGAAQAWASPRGTIGTVGGLSGATGFDMRLLRAGGQGLWSTTALVTPTAASLTRFRAWSNAPTVALPVSSVPMAVAPSRATLARPPLVVTPPTPRVFSAAQAAAGISLDLKAFVSDPIGAGLTWTAGAGFAGSGLSLDPATGVITGVPTFTSLTVDDPELVYPDTGVKLTAERGRAFTATAAAADGVRTATVTVELEVQPAFVRPEDQPDWATAYGGGTGDVGVQLQAAIDAALLASPPATVLFSAGVTYYSKRQIGVGTQRLYWEPGARILWQLGDDFVRAPGGRAYNPDAAYPNDVPFTAGWSARFEGTLYTKGASDHPRFIGDVRMRLERTDTHGGALANINSRTAVSTRDTFTVAQVFTDVLNRVTAIWADTGTPETTRENRIKAITDAAVGYVRDHYIFPKNIIRPTHPLTSDVMNLEAHCATPLGTQNGWMNEYSGTIPDLVVWPPQDVAITSQDYVPGSTVAHRVRTHGAKAGCFFGGDGLSGVIRGVTYRVTRDAGGTMEQKCKEGFFVRAGSASAFVGPLRLGPVVGYNENDDETCSIFHSLVNSRFRNCRFEGFDLTLSPLSRGFGITIFSSASTALQPTNQWENVRFTGPVRVRVEGGLRSFGAARIRNVPALADGGPAFDGAWTVTKDGQVTIDPDLNGSYTLFTYERLASGATTGDVELPGLNAVLDASGFINTGGKDRRVVSGALKTVAPVYIHAPADHGFSHGWLNAPSGGPTPTPQITLPGVATLVSPGSAVAAAAPAYVSPWPAEWNLGAWVYPSAGGRVRYDLSVDGASATRQFDPEADFALATLAQTAAEHWIALPPVDVLALRSAIDSSPSGRWVQSGNIWTCAHAGGVTDTASLRIRFEGAPDAPRLLAGQSLVFRALYRRSVGGSGDVTLRPFYSPSTLGPAVQPNPVAAAGATWQWTTWTIPLLTGELPARIQLATPNGVADRTWQIDLTGATLTTALGYPVTTVVTGA